MFKDNKYLGSLHKNEEDGKKKLNVKIDYSFRGNDNHYSYFTFADQSPDKNNSESNSSNNKIQESNNNYKKETPKISNSEHDVFYEIKNEDQKIYEESRELTDKSETF